MIDARSEAEVKDNAGVLYHLYDHKVDAQEVALVIGAVFRASAALAARTKL